MKRLVISAFVASSVVGFHSLAFAAPGIPHSDEWFEGRISGAFDYNPFLNSSDLDVDSDGSVVTLSGKVSSEVEKRLAEDITRSIDGVSAVKNEIDVDSSRENQNPSSFAQRVTDATTTAAVKSKLLSNKGTHGFAINVDTAANVVTLSGTVGSNKEKELAERIAHTTSGVREVRNELSVDPTTSGRTAARDNDKEGLATTVSDTWISTKIRTLLTFSSEFTGSDVNVSTDSGKVILQGVAQTSEQKRDIAEAVRQVVGVRSVSNNLSVRWSKEG